MKTLAQLLMTRPALRNFCGSKFIFYAPDNLSG